MAKSFGKLVAIEIVKKGKKIIAKFKSEIDEQNGTVKVSSKDGHLILDFDGITPELEKRIKEFAEREMKK